MANPEACVSMSWTNNPADTFLAHVPAVHQSSAEGKSASRLPKMSVSMSVEYNFPLASRGESRSRARARRSRGARRISGPPGPLNPPAAGFRGRWIRRVRRDYRVRRVRLSVNR